ncbi:MAG: hypothetical protein L0H63_04855, partial [Nitrococcus sp.]|nr:hypothetical protein [Nitrococcus sp.]
GRVRSFRRTVRELGWRFDERRTVCRTRHAPGGRFAICVRRENVEYRDVMRGLRSRLTQRAAGRAIKG